MKTLLITAIGSFSAETAIRGARELGMRVVGCDIYPAEWVVSSMDLDVFYQAPRADSPGYIEFINNIVLNEQVDYILPSTDAEIDVLSPARDRLSALLCISDKKCIEICRNKMAFNDAVKAVARIIPSGLVKDTPSPALPAVVKPVNGRSSQGKSVITDMRQYELADGTCMVQPYVEGSVITCDVCRNPKTGRIIVMSREELLRTPNGAGTTVRVFEDEKLSGMCRDVAEAIDIKGTVCLEFIKDANGDYNILECNPRFSGGIAFSVMAGYDFVTSHFVCFDESCKADIPDIGKISEQIIARRYEEYRM